MPALTADQALTEAAPVPAGEWVLVHGADGVTGGLAVQLAIARGATVVATARGPRVCRASVATARVSYSTITIPGGRPACEMHLQGDTESEEP